MTTAPSTLEFDVIVIGAGPVGENVADRAIAGGLTAVIVERELVGGECSYWACIPSKVLLRPQAVAQSTEGLPGVATTTVIPDEVFARRDRFVSNWTDDSSLPWLESAGITLVRGHGRIVAPKQVSVATPDGEQLIVARHAVVVTTGSVPTWPNIDGLDTIDAWSSREATASSEAPESLLVVGGGVVAVEMASAYTSLGSEVTVVARGDVLSTMEEFARDAVKQGLEAAGVRVLTHTSPQKFSGTNPTVVTLSNGETLSVSRVLVATGRHPRTGDVGLETVGLNTTGPLNVDETMLVVGDYAESASEWLYGVGDVNGRALLTHQGKYQARATGDIIAARASGKPLSVDKWGTHVSTADHVAVPHVVFSSPEVAEVGLTEAAATALDLPVRVVDYNLAHVSGARLRSDDYKGAARFVIDTEREVILGATFAGPDVSELLHAATIAIVGEVPLSRLWHAVPSFPTVSEVWLRLLEAYGRPE